MGCEMQSYSTWELSACQEPTLGQAEMDKWSELNAPLTHQGLPWETKSAKLN